LERARKLLQATAEESCRNGTEICVAENSLAAVELLLDVLRLETERGGYLATAHYRDVVWDGLRRIEDAAGRERVALELENKRSVWMRQWCAELLGEYAEPLFAAALLDVLDDKELSVQRSAARALGKLRFEGADAELVRRIGAKLNGLARHKDPFLRANALESRVRLEPASFQESFGQVLQDKDAGVRCALLGAAGAIDAQASEAFALAALGDADWRPRMRAVDVLATVRRPTALRGLIDALGDARPAVAQRARHHLQELTGEPLTQREAWEGWWRDKGPGFDFTKKREKGKRSPDESRTASFIGIVFESDHAAFLIDTSAEMAKTLASKGTSKEQAAQEELAETLARMQERMQFSLFTYAHEITPFAKKMPVDLNEKNREKALEFVRAQGLAGQKDIWQALETVLDDPSIDTVFLLSSGEPEIGRYVHWNRVTWHLTELNRFRAVVVHAIAYSDSQWYREQLQKIAEVTGGEFRYYE
jgi:hypothetical protein